MMQRKFGVTAARAAVTAAWLTAAAGAVAQVAVPPTPMQTRLPEEADGWRQVDNTIPRVDRVDTGSLATLYAEAGDVFEATLVSATPFRPEGMGIIATEYVFEVHSAYKGAPIGQMAFVEAGGRFEDGTGMLTNESRKLNPGDSYLVFTRPNADAVFVPFLRVLQVRGTAVADETGRLAVGLEGSRPVFGGTKSAPSLSYFPAQPREEPADAGPPEGPGAPAVRERAPVEVDPAPVHVETFRALLRQLALGHEGPVPIVRTVPPVWVEPRWTWCGYHRTSANYYTNMPNDNHWNWFNAAESEWDNLVEGAGNWWLFGHFNIRNEPINAGDGRNDAAVPSDAQMVAGGYGTWASHGTPNGINFTWYSGGSCTQIDETDSFANPAIGGSQAQFMKTMTHELGHALCLNHEDRRMALLYPGTYQQPPNYSGHNYCRMDDFNGGRAMIDWVNGNWPGEWDKRDFADMATWSMAHLNSGSSGSLAVTDLSSYSVPVGGTVQIRHMQVENRGTQTASGVRISWRLSPNNIISTADYEISSGTWTTFGPNSSWSNGTWDLTIPSSVPPGTYYIGWILTTDSAEFTASNNTAIMVRDYNSGFSERTLTVTCPSVAAPTGVSASDGTSCSSVTVSWNAVAGAVNYTIWRNTVNNSGSATQIGTDNASPYTDATAVPGTTYFYWVRANNVCQSSGFSSSNSGFVSPTPGAVSTVVATDGTFCPHTRVTWSSASNATNYSVWRSPDGNPGTAVLLGFDNASPYLDTTGLPGVTYYYFVQPHNDCGIGAYGGPEAGRRSIADFDGNGSLGVGDFTAFRNAYLAGNAAADCTGDGSLSVADFTCFRNAYLAGCSF